MKDSTFRIRNNSFKSAGRGLECTCPVNLGTSGCPCWFITEEAGELQCREFHCSERLLLCLTWFSLQNSLPLFSLIRFCAGRIQQRKTHPELKMEWKYTHASEIQIWHCAATYRWEKGTSNAHLALLKAPWHLFLPMVDTASDFRCCGYDCIASWMDLNGRHIVKTLKIRRTHNGYD